jgi:dihydrofolate reductase
MSRRAGVTVLRWGDKLSAGHDCTETQVAKVSIFNFTTLNGFFAAPDGDTGWHVHGGEEAKYSEEALASGNLLLFGRVTYDMMRAFWPTPQAAQAFPRVAKGMNGAEKLVFSRTLKTADWVNTRVVNADPADEVRRLKDTSSKDMTVLGSGTIVTQLAAHRLVDEYQIMLDPVALGAGRTIFEGLSQGLELRLKTSRVFQSGAVLLTYEPA